MKNKQAGRRTAAFGLTCILGLTFITGLAGCSSNSTSSNNASDTPRSAVPYTATFAVPTDCTQTTILATVLTTVPGAKFIDTPWQPSAGTELADVLNNAGIACTYGVQSAEIGATVSWVNEAGTLFSNRVSDWLKQGYKKVVLENHSDVDAYLLYKPQSETQEFHVWELHFLINTMWITINASYLDNLNDASTLIESAIASANV
ncbi:MAG: hypothetical protein F2766_03620 [Actinobacteria bacterium]|uniref:Unannotated protein n=1 Tax=freshwater metagenome TaxID=449393 RepID=A0A6J7AZI1_9ZZZZ|nr:hypothetical protein [Actinomycetota bacterium]